MFTFHFAKSAAALVFVCTAWLTSCATVPTTVGSQSEVETLVASDFMQILLQVETLDASATELRIPPLSSNTTGFDFAIRQALLDAGYSIKPLGLNLASEDPVVRTTVKKSSLQFGDVTVYTLFVGDVSFRRAYSISSVGNVQPESTMQAKGIDVSRLRQDDSIFVLDPLLAESEQTALDNPIVRSTERVGTPVVPDEISLVATTPQRLPTSESVQEELSVVPPVSNPAEELERVFVAPNPAGLLVVAESLLTFGDDSLVLGDDNKRRVRQFVQQFNKRTDQFSVFGCATSDEVSADNGERLAIGRSERIRSELLYAGVPDTKIIKENCDTARIGNDSPGLPRAVLLTLMRQSS